MDSVRVAVVGCGRVAGTHLQALQRIEEAHVVAVADVDSVAAKRMGATAQCPDYNDHQEMLERESPEIVCVCTPPADHPELAVSCLRNGAHVLCEKPFSIDTSSATRMVDAAERAGRFLTMASKFRFVEDVRKAKALIESGAVGKIVLCEIAFCGRADMRNRWQSDAHRSGGGVLIDNGSHAVDIIRYLLGPISRVQAQHCRKIQGLPVEDTSMIFVETVDGVWGRIDLSWSLEKDHDAYITLHGSEGMLIVGWNSSRYRRYDDGHWVAFGRGYDKLAAFTEQHRNFIACVRGRGPSLINAEDSLESVRVIEVAYWSSRSNKWLEVEECLTR